MIKLFAKWMRFRLMLAIFVLGSTPVVAQTQLVRIGVVIDGPWERNDDISGMIQQEILTLTENEFDVQFPAEKMIMADWTLEGVKRALDQQLVFT